MKHQIGLLAMCITRKCLLLVGMLIGGSSIHAQDFQSIIEDFRKEYSTGENLHVVMDINVFDDSTSGAPYFSEHAEIRRKGTNYRYSLASNELLMNDRYIVVVNKLDKEIIYSSRDLKGEKIFQSEMVLPIDSVFKRLGHPRLVHGDDDRLHYRVGTNYGDINAIDIILKRQAKIVDEIRYTYRDGQMARIHFTRFDVNPSFEERTFSEENFINFQNNMVAVPQHLSGYIILQQ